MTDFSKYYADFDIAGMRYWDGAFVLQNMKPGDNLKLVAEPDNPADANAVALYWQDTKIGYVPRVVNDLPAQLLRFGHTDVLECRILKVNSKAETWDQVRAGLYFIDKSV